MSDCASNFLPIDVANIVKRLHGLSSAEDFFNTLGIPYDQDILNVARLHILKRMGQYLAEEDFEGLGDRIIAARARSTLERAYSEFAVASPLSQRVFKVLKDRDPDKSAVRRGTFVSLETASKPFPGR